MEADEEYDGSPPPLVDLPIAPGVQRQHSGSCGVNGGVAAAEDDRPPPPPPLANIPPAGGGGVVVIGGGGGGGGPVTDTDLMKMLLPAGEDPNSFFAQFVEVGARSPAVYTLS